MGGAAAQRHGAAARSCGAAGAGVAPARAARVSRVGVSRRPRVAGVRMQEDLYATLGVPRSASEKDIKNVSGTGKMSVCGRGRTGKGPAGEAGERLHGPSLCTAAFRLERPNAGHRLHFPAVQFQRVALAMWRSVPRDLRIGDVWGMYPRCHRPEVVSATAKALERGLCAGCMAVRRGRRRAPGVWRARLSQACGESCSELRQLVLHLRSFGRTCAPRVRAALANCAASCVWLSADPLRSSISSC
eukprot:6196838-Pleurochrysis_carterae.AAC.2